MTTFFEKHRKHFFIGIAGIIFLMIYAYNLLTPYMSDDLFYLVQVEQAQSIWDLVKQQYSEYLSNSGRVIGQFNIRLSLSANKQIFNLVNSGMFVALVLLIYANIKRKKKYDILVLLLSLTFVWKFSVFFGQTILWICGACNYLWGSVFILGFVTWYRYLLEKAENVKHPLVVAMGTFLFGVIAGWCNENTSGGSLLLVLLFSLNFFLAKKQEGKKKIYPFMITSVLGMCCGLLGMVMAPGVRKRNEVMGEGEYTGFVGLLSRIYKNTLTLRELFWTVMVITIIAIVFLVLQKKLSSFQQIRKNESMIFLVAFLATSYVLSVMSSVPQDRAFFGAGVFLFIACMQAIIDVEDKEQVIRAAKYSLVSILCLWFCFTYLDNLVNLARIYREENERIELILAEKNDPNSDGYVVVPQYREPFENVYSNAHVSDMQEDPGYWINVAYESYYGVSEIVAIPRDQWNELYGEE